MLLSLVIVLRPTRAGTLPAATGTATHGVFFRWLTAVDPALALELHELKGLKPFTVSGLQPDNNLLASTTEIELSPHQTYNFRVTSLEKVLSEVLIEQLYRKPPSSLVILNRMFQVERIAIVPKEHPWANVCEYQDLLRPNEKAAKRIILFFRSPTSFKSAGRSLPLPLPAQTFSSLAKRWNSYSNLGLPAEFFDFLEIDLVISEYELKSELVLMEGSKHGSKLVCFRGWCQYTSFSDNQEWANYLHLLGRFAFYAGIGYKTTQGFGQTLMIDKPR